MMTTQRVANGEFKVLLNGEPTRFTIINGSHGYRGNGATNTYGIVAPNVAPVWVGSLQSAKKLVAVWLHKGL